MPRKIVELNCVGCGNCQRVCIVGCITQIDNKKRLITESACVDCGACQLTCTTNCIIKI